MPTKNIAGSAVLTLMFVSLIIIYLYVPQNDLVTFLAVVIMAIGLVISLNGDWNEIGSLAVMSGILSVTAAYFAGQQLLDGFGAVAFPLVFGLLLLGFVRWVSTNTVPVPEDHAVLVSQFFSGNLRQLNPPFAPPLVPLLERPVATIPLYELSQDVRVEKINTSGTHNVDSVEVQIRYRVDKTRPQFALGNIPNRGRIQNEVAREMGRNLDQARLDTAFWETLLARQMKAEVDDIVRKVVYREAQNAVGAWSSRERLSEAVRQELHDLTRRWGIEVTDAKIDHFEVAEDRFRNADPARNEERENRARELDAKREATRIRLTGSAEAETEAARVSALLDALRAAGVPITEDIVNTILAAPDPLEMLLNEPLPVKPSANGKGDAGAPKR